MSRKTKTMLFAALGLVVVASALVAPIVGAMSSIGPRPEKAVTITLYGSYTSPGGWGRGPNNITEPGPTLTVDQGDVVTFQLFANDSTSHQLIIDVDNSHSNNSGDGWSYQFSSKTTALSAGIKPHADWENLWPGGPPGLRSAGRCPPAPRNLSPTPRNLNSVISAAPPEPYARP